MAYTALDTSKPDAATQAGTAFGSSARSNLVAIRDCIAAMGMAQGFDYSTSGGTAAEPAQLYFKRSTEWIKVVLTWSGGNVTKAAFYYSSNSGGLYDGMADAGGKYVLTLTYDGSGNCTATSWGSTP